MRSIACDAGVKISYLSDFAPENFRRNFSKIRKPKNSSGNEFPEEFLPIQRNRKIYLNRRRQPRKKIRAPLLKGYAAKTGAWSAADCFRLIA